MSSANRLWKIAAVLLVCIGLDQLTKAIAKATLPREDAWSYLGDTVRLQLAHNYGAFLSLGDSLPPGWRQALLSAGVGIVLLGLLVYLLWWKNVNPRNLVPLSLILAGGAGNLIDRVAYGGYVVDFLNLGIGTLRTGVFNVADVAIMAGVVWLLLTDFLVKPGKQETA
ncbi:MAG TPA: signal peptidase II [Povalibacter sp.]|uniref:signal peptidase II n=1 Tax=Povalibacter sp. TaxID=1962978 RepID=UPI002C6E7BB5|nr:signal peptidase II [Povalibacter sp.]HMN43854.1 signal peptidase II [Povalibacter sp.]